MIEKIKNNYLQTLSDVYNILQKGIITEHTLFIKHLYGKEEASTVHKNNYNATKQLLKDVEDERKKVIGCETTGGLRRRYHR